MARHPVGAAGSRRGLDRAITPVSIATTPVGLSPARRRIAFAILLLGGALPTVNFFIVNIALPSIRTELSASAAQVQLVIAVYTATYALFLITGGRLGDLFGRTRLLMIGMVLFVVTSVLCGVATSGTMLVVGRVLQGFSAAIFAPQALGTIRVLYANDRLGWALNVYSTVIGVAVAGGQLIGGLVVTADFWGLGWRLGFLLNLPLGLLVIVSAAILLPETGGQRRTRFDFGGVLLLSVALACAILPLTLGRERGWPIELLLMFAAAPFLLLLFWWFENRVSRQGGMPVLDPALFHVAGFRRGVLVALLFFFTTPFYFLFSIYQQSGRGMEALANALSILPYGIGTILGPMVAPYWPARFRPYQFAIGMTIQVTGYAAIGLCVGALVGGWPLFTLMFIAGFGQGVAMPRMINAVIGEVPAPQAGLAAGILNSVLQIGSAISVSAIGSLFFAALGTATTEAAYGRAFAIAMVATVWSLTLAMALGLRRD
jgi:MFS family permease